MMYITVRANRNAAIALCCIEQQKKLDWTFDKKIIEPHVYRIQVII